MAHARKHVCVTSHGPLSVGSVHPVPWEDVWLITNIRRRPLRLAPCLTSRQHLLNELSLKRSLAEESLDKYLAREAAWSEIMGESPDTPSDAQARHESLRAAFKAEVQRQEALLSRLDSEGYMVDETPDGTPRQGKYGLANVYTAAPMIDRIEAERMLDFYLSQLGIRRARYRWRGCGMVTIPVSLSMETEG